MSAVLTSAQYLAICQLHKLFGDRRPADQVINGFRPQFDLPAGYVAGWVQYATGEGVYFGVSPAGEASS